MFRHINCKNCQKSFDPMLEECPDCKATNPDAEKNGVKNLTVFPVAKQISIFLIGWLGFQIIGAILSVIISLYFSGKAATTEEFMALVNSSSSTAIINFGAYAILSIVLGITISTNFQQVLKSFKKIKPLYAAIAGAVLIYVFEIVYGIFCDSLNIAVTDNTNQSNVVDLVKTFPALSIVVVGILAPICEELTYRVGLFSLLRRKAKWLAFLVTIVVFTLIHFDFTSVTNVIQDGNAESIAILINELLNIPSYAFAAFVFSFIYDKYGLAASVYAHIFNNLFAVVISLL